MPSRSCRAGARGIPRRGKRRAVSRAGLAQKPNGKRHSHQYRISRAALAESRRQLLANLAQLRASSSFDDLFELVEQISGPIPGIGELTVYDTALRIGARFELRPTTVYLHAGTRKGARAFGLDWRGRVLEVEDLPKPLRELTPREIEDVLCIYKDGLEGSSCGVKAKRPSTGC